MVGDSAGLPVLGASAVALFRLFGLRRGPEV
jgi:hypothetical protein